jgi:hypothetical protein
MVVPPALCYSLGEAKKGPLANVFPPHLNSHTPRLELLYELYSDWCSRSCVYGFLRHPITCMPSFLLC